MTQAAIQTYSLASDLTAKDRLEALQLKLEECVRDLESGAVPTLTGVELEVERLCQQVLALPKEDAKPFMVALQALSDAFSALAAAMQSMKQAVAGELSDLQVRAKAHKAYGMRGTANVPPLVEGE